MDRSDAVGLIGLALFVVGIGGGVEMTLLAQSQAYRGLLAAGGNADPSAFASQIQHATLYLKLGVPVGMLGVVLLVLAARSYLRSGRLSVTSEV